MTKLTTHNTAGHTPGPWRIEQSGPEESIGIRIDSNDVCGIAYVSDANPDNGYKPKTPDNEQLANARLIAACPDMYELLLEIRDNPDINELDVIRRITEIEKQVKGA